MSTCWLSMPASSRRGLVLQLRRDGFDREALERFSALAEEARAATASYLAGAIATVETSEAGRRFRKRIARERHDEQS